MRLRLKATQITPTINDAHNLSGVNWSPISIRNYLVENHIRCFH